MIRRSVQRLLFAFGFLTSLPGLGSVRADAGASSAFFPLVGAFLGICIFGMSFITLSPLSVAVFIVVFLLFATRGMHADGVLDTFDGFLSGRSEKDSILGIMKDSNVGALGFVSGFCIYLLKVVMVYEMLRVPHLYRSLLILPTVLSRGGVSLYCRAFQPASKGMGTSFSSTIKIRHILLSFVIMELFSFRPSSLSVLILPCFILVLWMLWGIICRKKIGGFTGDTIGAGIEMTEVAGFALVTFVFMRL